MTETTAYNGVRAKQVNQINQQDGEALAAYSAPDFFISDDSAFAAKRTGNQVQFFTTGEDYFKDLAGAIGKAERCIFITGWQVNYDVLLDGERTLWRCLHQALTSKPQLRVYVMPWLSPGSSVGTYDIETMLAIFQLNAGLDGGPRAFCTPAIQQSDMKGLGATFSHHQKSVVIDNTLGYVGGIDLAYGRRDDNNFSLTSADRLGNDAYNPGLPKLGWMELDGHVSRTGLIMAALFDLSKPALGGPVPMPTRAQMGNSINHVLDFFRGPPLPIVQSIQQGVERFGGTLERGRRAVAELKYRFLERSIRATSELIQLVVDDLPGSPELKERLQLWLAELQRTPGNMTVALRIKSIHLINLWMSETDIGQVFRLLSGASFDTLPADLVPKVNELGSSVLWHLYGLLQEQTSDNQAPFPYLLEHAQPLSSPDNSCLAEDQPRMPWQDVHCSICGPSVYDLSRNFIDRWNGQQAYLANTPAPQDTAIVSRALETVMTWLNLLIRKAHLHHFLDNDNFIRLDLKQPTPVWIADPQRLPTYPESVLGGVSVQVLRSAGERMLSQEQVGRRQASVSLPVLPGFESRGIQANCKIAMLQAISSAQQFIYIENQFFQTEFGREGELFEDVPLSGPMASLRDPKTLRQDLVLRVGLREALKARDIWRLNWVEIDAISRNADKESSDFLDQLFGMWGLNAQGWLSHRLGEVQQGVINDIGKALAERIGRAIDEHRPFHVYMILPVHPEGPLNVPNIMHQVHLTMQSLAFGEQSLIKRIQRRMGIRGLLDRGISRDEAERIIERRGSDNRPVYELQDWSRYLTLLNLRTWDELDGRVVTEQIYVHSKLLIADDRVAILGSANINDRSLLGPRDSELAVIVRDSTPVTVKLDGKNPQQVSKAVHELRVDLWRKHFGLSLSKASKVQPATALAACLSQPAAMSTWQAIKTVARQNQDIYERSFDFIPRNISQVQRRNMPDTSKYPDGFPASIWPTWGYQDLEDLRVGGNLMEAMPYEAAFWRGDIHLPPRAYARPQGVQGFICQLPIQWTRGENNDSGINLTILTQLIRRQSNRFTASAAAPIPGQRDSTT
ncbi:phospholipase D-like domain-containing protein [Pseudomonas sp. FME51]|uniref:phospholipase D-like domain-containing protein n=1 Tax=Pseudomonas sp. FME51 TaxID=2742609 RepID=UPI0018667DFC|nr:phospholipase D-like domain-containing protein [Pseudomonas sp. FME51]